MDDIDGAFDHHRQGESVFPVTASYSGGGRVKKKAKSRANSDDEVRTPISGIAGIVLTPVFLGRGVRSTNSHRILRWASFPPNPLS